MVAPESSFAPLWAPAFIKDLVPEDHCHLNGLAVDGGRLQFVTALSGRSGKDAWRRDRPKGVIIDVSSKKVVVSDLWMPHSPRIRDRKIWLHKSGQGSFGLIEHGKFVERLACPGYTRGLDFHESVAALGISKPRADSIEGLPLKQRLAAKGAGPSCAVLLFDTASNSVVHSIRFLSTVERDLRCGFPAGSQRCQAGTSRFQGSDKSLLHRLSGKAGPDQESSIRGRREQRARDHPRARACGSGRISQTSACSNGTFVECFVLALAFYDAVRWRPAHCGSSPRRLPSR